MYTIKDRLKDYLAALESSDKDYDLEVATQHFYSGVGVGFHMREDITRHAATREQFIAHIHSVQDELSAFYNAQLDINHKTIH